MPPKAKTNREMIVNAAFEIAKTEGAENISARTVARKAGCSTQPVMYYFQKIEDMKTEAYLKARGIFMEFITKSSGYNKGPIFGIGLQYIRFAASEKQLFRFLFQSSDFPNQGPMEFINAEEFEVVLMMTQRVLGVSKSRMKEIFLAFLLFAHGYAGMLANGDMEYDEPTVVSYLEKTFTGVMNTMKGEEK